jgi:phosphate transport system permease protein
MPAPKASSFHAARHRTNAIWMALSVVAAAIGLTGLFMIIVVLFWQGFSGLSLAVFTQMTPPPGSSGGLLNAIAGSLMMTAIGVLVGTPLGMLAGTYLAEYGRYSRLASVVRFINDILLSAPSIVIGLFVYEIVVVPMGHFSGIAGSIALAVLVVPIVVRTTENMLNLVPNTLREAGAALGMPRSLVIQRIAYRAVNAGLLTGVLLAVARVSGETAPLLFTALNNQFWSLDLTQPMSSLPTVIFQFALSPYKEWQALAWTGALIITLSVLALSISARVLSARAVKA